MTGMIFPLGTDVLQDLAILLADANERTMLDQRISPPAAEARRRLCFAIGVQRNDTPANAIRAALAAALAVIYVPSPAWPSESDDVLPDGTPQLRLLSCRYCGQQIRKPGQDNLPWCLHGLTVTLHGREAAAGCHRSPTGLHEPEYFPLPGYEGDPADAKADAMKALHDAILGAVPPQLRDATRELLEDLLALYGGDDLDEAATAEVIARALGDTADFPAMQAARDSLAHLACWGCGAEAHADGTPPQPDDHSADCPRYRPPRWEVAFDRAMVVDAKTAELAAARAAAEDNMERAGKGWEPDPNAHAWVRKAGPGGVWQMVYLDDEAIAAAEIAIGEEEN